MQIINKNKYFLIIISILIIICLIFFTIPTVFLFIGGVDNISLQVDNLKYSNTSKPWDSFFEKTQWPTVHHFENFYLTLLFSTIILYYIKEKKWSNWLKILIHYLCALAFTVAFAGVWEITEALMSLTVQICNYYGIKLLFITRFGNESIGDIILNDIVQALLAGSLALLFVLTEILKPVSWLIFKKKWYVITIRAFIWIIFEVTVFVGALQKSYKSYTIVLGYYMFIWIKFIGISLLYIEDRCSIIEGDKSFRLTKRDVDIFYIIIYLMAFILWTSTANLMTWGFFSSNGSAIIFFIILLIIKFGFKYFKRNDLKEGKSGTLEMNEENVSEIEMETENLLTNFKIKATNV